MEKSTMLFGTVEEIVKQTEQPLIAKRIEQNYNKAKAKKHYNQNVRIKNQMLPCNKVEKTK